jgi:hypothetical protein
MAIDPTISLNARAPDPVSSLSSILDLGTRSIELKKAKATLEPDIQRSQSAARLAKTTADIAEATTPAQIQQMQTQAHQALLNLNDAERQSVGTFVSSLAGSDPGTVKTKLDAMAEFQPQLKPAVDYIWQAHLKPVADNPKSFADTVRHIGLGTMTVPEQFQTRTASGPTVTNNQQSAVVNQNPGADIPVGSVAPGTGVQMQIPVTAPVFNPGTNAQNYYGPGGQGGPQTSPALGQPENIGGTVEAVNKDWTSTVAGNQTASRDIGVLQNIIQHAPGASTGVGADRRAMLNGIAGYLGMSVEDLSKTDTDLLAKNANMIALAGGNTDAARGLAEMANPNIKMTKDAIISAARQVMAQKQMGLVKQQYMGQFKNDPQLYTQKLAEFNSISDPRILQWRDMSLKEKTAMKSSMSEGERNRFKDMLQKAESLGIVK